MISLKKCKEILDKNEDKKSYTSEEVKELRDILFKFSKIEVEKSKIIKK